MRKYALEEIRNIANKLNQSPPIVDCGEQIPLGAYTRDEDTDALIAVILDKMDDHVPEERDHELDPCILQFYNDVTEAEEEGDEVIVEESKDDVDEIEEIEEIEEEKIEINDEQDIQKTEQDVVEEIQEYYLKNDDEDEIFINPLNRRVHSICWEIEKEFFKGNTICNVLAKIQMLFPTISRDRLYGNIVYYIKTVGRSDNGIDVHTVLGSDKMQDWVKYEQRGQ